MTGCKVSRGLSVAISLENVSRWSKAKYILKRTVPCIYTQTCNTAFCVSLVWDDYPLTGCSRRYRCSSVAVGNIAFQRAYVESYAWEKLFKSSQSAFHSLCNNINHFAMKLFFVPRRLMLFFWLQLKQTAGLEEQSSTLSPDAQDRVHQPFFSLFILAFLPHLA